MLGCGLKNLVLRPLGSSNEYHERVRREPSVWGGFGPALLSFEMAFFFLFLLLLATHTAVFAFCHIVDDFYVLLWEISQIQYLDGILFVMFRSIIP
jgi:hypothetical protein